MKNYDAIIIGAGPNGLVLGAYLAKADLKVLLLESRIEIGGGLSTEEITIPGFYHNIHSIYHMMADYMPPYKDLKLEEEYDCRYVHPPIQIAMPLTDGRCLALYTDVEKSCDSISKFSKKDADTYREIHSKYYTYMDEFLIPATYFSPIALLGQIVKLQKTQIGKEIIELSEKSPQEIINGLFENEHVRTLMLYLIPGMLLGARI